MNRAGSTLVEAIVAAALASIVAAAAATLLRAQSQVAQQVTQRSEYTDAMRSAMLTLRAELQTAVPVVDVRAIARDSLLMRVFRGVAEVCARRDGAVYMRYRGLRAPDPAKDSVLAVGIETAVPLEAVQPQPSACASPGGEAVLQVTISASAPIGSLWLFFESGSYHLQGHALRYRPAGSNRQPITNEVIDDSASGFAMAAGSAAAFRIQLRARKAGRGAESTFRFLNRP